MERLAVISNLPSKRFSYNAAIKILAIIHRPSPCLLFKTQLNSIGLRRWYINITITILLIMHHRVFYLKQRFGDWILSPPNGESYPVGSNIYIAPETERSSSYWDLLSRCHLKTERESSLRNVVFLIKDRTMDHVQNCDSYINIPSS
jgi:hypothetical protein